MLRGIPRQLLVVATGNITNKLLGLFEANLALVVEAFDQAGLVEMSSTSLVIHDDHLIRSSGNE